MVGRLMQTAKAKGLDRTLPDTVPMHCTRSDQAHSTQPDANINLLYQSKYSYAVLRWAMLRWAMLDWCIGGMTGKGGS